MHAPHPDRLTRRELIQRGALGTMLLSSAGLFTTGCAGYRNRIQPDDEDALRFFSVKEYAIALAAADAMLPGESDGFPDHRELKTVLKLDRELAQWDPVRSKDIPLLMGLLEHGTPLFGHSFRRFSRLPLESRRAYLAGWGESGILLRRSGFIALKGLFAFYYFSDERVWPDIGYDGTWFDRFSIPITPVEGLPA